MQGESPARHSVRGCAYNRQDQIDPQQQVSSHAASHCKKREMGRESLRWRALDACVAALALPSLLLLLVMLTSDQETPRSPVERVQTLALASLLLLVSVFVCCYVAQRLRLVASCPILSFAGYKHEPASEPLAPWQHKTSNTTSITQQSPCVP
ncbi:hypothetical protein B566_EDAN013422, partial [Ephemera danica]